MDTLHGSPSRATIGAGGAGALGVSTKKGQTMNNAKTMIIGGTLVAKPFATSEKPFVKKEPVSIIYGKVDTILNPPNKDRTTQYRSTHNSIAINTQTAGTIHKRQVPYSVNAARNRIKNEPKRLPPPFTSTLNFEGNVLNKSTHPYRTIKGVVESSATQPLHTIRGFTNDFIVAEMTKRAHKPIYE